ncbi:MAG: 50S ribosomal protein L4 [Nitrospirae bacterium CG_4_10_14_0_8_um_filter_41_23]|nr:50S ribosomal protein L4 [Nitrospirota bacterium]OIP60595.1 MAG: 50S ribosomal protein L4 [Nitrospirae bacterium CG2_30_41_42]PIQ94991.1 MAG: 50S ribosomal protein L4 [Nitrospirae bacterium CG11_big_fil_rev_8_21_14_0_20_41_14]PIV41471.1 MAG: 50S ribosomal protein L4 [Nitrospirae bacterium CG02_land_8_20_14_3_00_41_53]PIW87141.1 MAG: 50S ribosomal protein L4 [Nitrospirae bacterium CG_4_8_14_3_um_filter_41_47]PIY87087.1 MAG: 50S ribosomal protein L4 [Nitrospirae bacterium CG_4_10_14_0_8_um_fi
MPEVEVKDKNNNIVGKMNLSDNIFGVHAKEGVVHSAVVNFLANQRQGTHSTKTKGLVSGGGKKPWKQKGTGRARAGSIRSPLWRGGGIVFGPQPRDYSYNLPKKVKRLALMTAFYRKLADGEVVVIDNFAIEKPKTKEMKEILKNLGLTGKSILIVIPEKDNSVVLSARNIPSVSVIRSADLNTYDVIAHNVLLMTKHAAIRIEDIKGS